jgi:hypothetical protein
LHIWGEWPDELFIDVGNAADEIGQFCRRWGRISVTQTKEKFGTARVYCHFGIHQMHSITHPGYVYSRYPNWLWHIDCRFIAKFFNFIRLHKIITPYQIWIYKLAYKRAFKKYPHIVDEIYYGADQQQLIETQYSKFNNDIKELLK